MDKVVLISMMAYRRMSLLLIRLIKHSIELLNLRVFYGITGTLSCIEAREETTTPLGIIPDY